VDDMSVDDTSMDDTSVDDTSDATGRHDFAPFIFQTVEPTKRLI
jgi:hypothetical protein